ncbi:MAG: triacylglycerol lipase [Phycisphaerales bacterium]|jgi:triacylglycerol lipase|nr:triacylglycerol lipase [Phycisphaerales bacterium]MEA2733956.1 triacylglycerol lipase [Humisphaera sp.]
MLPIVLHHGLLGSGDIAVGPLKFSYFRNIDRAITERGHPVIVSRVHPTGPIELRARQLKVNILRGLKQHNLPRDSRVLIIAHSMGGLDARHMIAELGMADRVAGLLSITTPHRGSAYADWCVENLGRKLGCARLLNMMGLDLRAISDLTTESCRRFNREVKNVAGVQYFSVSGARPWHRVPPWAMHAHKIVTAAEGDNDCVVSVKSSTWGTHLGVWPADHFHAINHRLVMEIKQRTGDITPYWMKAIETVKSHLG